MKRNTSRSEETKTIRILSSPSKPLLHHGAIEGWLPVSEGRDPIPNGLINVSDHLASAKGISMVTPTVSFAPDTVNASLLCKLEEASIDLLPARRKKGSDSDSPIRIHARSQRKAHYINPHRKRVRAGEE